jgi:hypothetical protein
MISSYAKSILSPTPPYPTHSNSLHNSKLDLFLSSLKNLPNNQPYKNSSNSNTTSNPKTKHPHPPALSQKYTPFLYTLLKSRTFLSHLKSCFFKFKKKKIKIISKVKKISSIKII